MDKQENMTVTQSLTLWNAIVIINVYIGFTLGKTANTVSPTSPRDVEATPSALTPSAPNCPPLTTTYVQQSVSRSLRIYIGAETLHFNNTLSAAVTSAQKFGAQYAWFKPRVKGKSLLNS